MSEGKLVKRRFIRAAPDPLDVAFLSYDVSSKEFRPDCVALIIEESARGGCGLVFRIPVNLNVGQIVLIQLGRLAPLTAEVVWTKSLSDIVQHVGFRFLE